MSPIDTLRFTSQRAELDLLVVGDGEALSDVRQTLVAEGHQVAVVETGAEALAALAQKPVAVVLTRLALSDFSGLELCRRVRRDPLLDQVAVVVEIPEEEPEQVLAALEAGADSFLKRPWAPETPTRRLRAACRFRGLQGTDSEQLLAFGQQRRVVADPGAILQFLGAALEGSPASPGAGREELPEVGSPPGSCPLQEHRRHGEPRCGRHEVGLASRIFESTADGIIVTDVDAQIVAANPAFCAMTGYTEEELIGENPRLMKSDRHDAAFYRAMWQTLLQEGHWQGEVWDRRKNGVVYPKWLTISAMRNSQGHTTHYVGISSDITTAKRSEAELERLAHYDALTGLPNRILFRDRLQQAMGQSRRGGTMLALMFLDLDGFKEVNTTLGHRAGDAILEAVAKRLVGCVRESDTVARLGGDEFTVILPGFSQTDAVTQVAWKILDRIAAPYGIEGQERRLTTSIGIALYPQDAGDPETLVRNADAAMYHAKELGRNRYRFYSGELHQRAVQRHETETELRRAIEREEFVLHYQPRVALTTGRVVSVEALVRWNHPTQGLIPPGRFIPIAEETRLILPLGEWVLREACRQLRAWADAGLPDFGVSVNLAAPQFEQADLSRRIAAALIDAGTDPKDLEVELTESTAMGNPDATAGTLLELKAIGIAVSIDDFGTGYSSLGYLRRFPIDTLKIDRSFVRDLDHDPDDAVIAKAVIGLARSLGFTVVAEGVETEAQLAFLIEHGCDEVQGYLLSRPVPADQLEALLRSRPSLLP